MNHPQISPIHTDFSQEICGDQGALKSADIPLFASTEAAERYGRELRATIGPDQFQTLVRTWFVAQMAFGNTVNLQVAANLAHRVQTLREAIQAFLFDGGNVAPRITPIPRIEDAGAKPLPSSEPSESSAVEISSEVGCS